MNVLVTGHSGFLGKFLCSRLISLEYNVLYANSSSCDLTKSDSLSQFDSIGLDWIIHLAAWTQAGDFCVYHPGEQWIINQKINTNVLSWWKEKQCNAKLISMGTSCSYSPSLELVEENYLFGQPIDSLYTYGMTKRMLHIGKLALNRQFGLPFLTLVPSTLFGPGYHADGRQMHFVFDLIRKILRGKLYDDPVILWGDGYQKRELVFVEDFVEIMIRLAKTQTNDLINIGAGQELEIRGFAKLICDEVQFPIEKIYYDTSRYTGAKSKCLVTEKLKRLLPDFKMTSLKVGLSKTIEWFLREKEVLLPSADIRKGALL